MKWRVIGERVKRRKVWFAECECACGTRKLVEMRRDVPISLSCRPCSNRRLRTKHGHAPFGNPSQTYRSWQEMIRRCVNPKRKAFPQYGGRGIRVCDRWRESFEAFLADVGECPSPDHSIDRYPDNNGNYEFGNVRWATKKEQARNRRSSRFVTAHGSTATIAEWAERIGIDQETIRVRIAKGWPPERAVDPWLHRAGGGKRRPGSGPPLFNTLDLKASAR